MRGGEEDEMKRKLLTCGFYVVKPSCQLKPLSTGADLYLFLKRRNKGKVIPLCDLRFGML